MVSTGLVEQFGPGLSWSDPDFCRLADAFPDLIELLDMQGKRLFLNRACTLLFPHPEVLAGTCPAADPGLKDRDMMREMLAGVARSGSPDSRQFERILPDGTIRWFECRLSVLPVTTIGGGAPLLLMASRDISGRRRMEQLLQDYQTRLKLAQQFRMLGSWEYNYNNETVLMSEGFARIYGLPTQPLRLERKDLYALVHPEDRDRLTNLRNEMHDDAIVYDVQYRIIRTDGQTRVLHSRWCLEKDAGGRLSRSIGFCEDITERVTAEADALTNEAHFRFLAVNAKDMAIFLLDLCGRVMNWNPGAEKLYGYRSDEVLNRPCSIFFIPGTEDTNILSGRLESASMTGKLETEEWRVRKGGDRFRARITVTPFYDNSGTHIGYMKLTHDLTKQLCLEDILHTQADRLKANARRLVELQEAERQHLARELHDLVGPKLTALGINLQLINSQVDRPADKNVTSILKDSVNYVHATTDIIRYIIGELRPHALDDYGLYAALRSHVDQFMKLTGIRVRIDERSASVPVPDLIKMSLFRIAQEALNNIARHSQATSVQISLTYASDSIGLSIHDNGVGFEREGMEMSDLSRSYGLSIMRERAEAVGASFNLETGPGKGVHIYVECHI